MITRSLSCRRLPSNALILLLIWTLGAICDRIWLSFDNSIPAWDQADYLTGTLNYLQALQNLDLGNYEWWQNLWLLSSKIPPLTYIVAGLFQSIFGVGQEQAMLVMLLFSGILIASVYGLGKILFNSSVGLWAAALCQVLPGLYLLRLEFLLDYPLAAIVTFSFFCLTLWHFTGERERLKKLQKDLFFQQTLASNGKCQKIDHPVKISSPSPRLTWLNLCNSSLLAILFGISLGLALLVKQTSLFFLVTPIAWVGIVSLRQFRWLKLLQLVGSLWVSTWVFGGWYRTNWLTILTSGKRATIDSAIAEGDAPLNTINAWIYYWQQLPQQVSLPLLLIPIFTLLFYWGRFGEEREGRGGDGERGRRGDGEMGRWGGVRNRKLAKSPNRISQSLKWLAIFLISAYLLSSSNPNKDARYITPYLPTFAVFLAYGFTRVKSLFGQRIRWGTLGLAVVLMLLNLFPIGGFAGGLLTQTLSPQAQRHPETLAEIPHKEIITEIIRTEPYLRSTLGVLPSTEKINQHNLNYYGALTNFQVYGRQVGTRNRQIEQDARSLSWFLTKTGEQGSVPQSQPGIVKTVETSPNFKIQHSWRLSDGSTLNLYHQKEPTVEVMSRPLEYSSSQIIHEKNILPAPVTLTQLIFPENSPPGVPIPVTYRWTGSWEELKNGLVLLTWRKEDDETQKPLETKKKDLNSPPQSWLHDHAIGMGNLYTAIKKTEGNFQAIERTAMLPPANIVPGKYRLEASYLNRLSGEIYAINTPQTSITINPQATATPAPELDLITQLRTLATNLPKGTQAIAKIFDEVARINQYDPTQDYLLQAQLTSEYRLRHYNSDSDLAYTVALANVLQRRVKGAINSLERVTQIDSQNPFAWAYLAFVRLYNWQPQAADKALKIALKINPNQSEFQALAGVAALMQGNFIKAWENLSVLIRS
ncbi:glycosyl transferase family protein [Calothrix sp. NIES-4101]|nr:glycosyl transferase family protein [Calothrix sp. NIES-4101]